MTVNEKIKVRLEEVEIWKQVMDRIDYARTDAKSNITRYQVQIENDELEPDCWQAKEIARLKLRLSACESVESAVLNCIG